MRQFIKIRNIVFEEEVLLFERTTAKTNDLILAGDYYHDKIEKQIDGFFTALDYLNIPYEVIEKLDTHQYFSAQ